MSLEEMLIVHELNSLLSPAERDELADLLDLAPLPAHSDTRLPLRELRLKVVHELGEECQAALQLAALIL